MIACEVAVHTTGGVHVLERAIIYGASDSANVTA